TARQPISQALIILVSYWMMPMQQPFAQYVPVGHAWPAEHTVSPFGHVLPLQFGGRSVIGSPGHSTQVVPPRSPPLHIGLGVQRRHFVGSASVCAVQFGEMAGLISMS